MIDGVDSGAGEELLEAADQIGVPEAARGGEVCPRADSGDGGID